MIDSAILKRCPCPEHEGPNPLPVSAFGKDRSKADGLASRCKACAAGARRRQRAASPEKSREDSRRYRAANLDASLERTRRWKQANPERHRDGYRRWRQVNPEKHRENYARWQTALKAQVLDHYGQSCACCGTAGDLTIDHVNGGGAAHRIALFGADNAAGPPFWRWLVKQGFPPGFQTLCRPCNSSKKDGAACRIDHHAAYMPSTCPITVQPADG